MMSTERPESIESGFAHGSIAFVEQRCQDIPFGVEVFANVVVGYFVGTVVFFDQLVMRAALCVFFRREHFGRGAFAKIVIARESARGRKMRL